MSTDDEDTYHSMAEIKAMKLEYPPYALLGECAVKMFGDNPLFYYRDSPTHDNLEFWYFNWVRGPATRDGVEVDPAQYEMIFHGWGTHIDGVRHLYFSNNGYVFYPFNGPQLLEALAHVQKLCPGHDS